MIKFLLLRGQEPKDRNPVETYYNNLSECDDIYTLMVNQLLEIHPDWMGTIVYWGGNRRKTYSFKLLEIRETSIHPNAYINYDIVWARGGFPEYDPVLFHIRKHNPKAFIIYYGANAKRFYPKNKFKDYNLILVDSYEQQKICQRECPNIPCTLFIKPAPDNLIGPVVVPKKYDVCYPANGRQQQYKGQAFVYNSVPEDITVYNLGTPCDIKCPNNVYRNRVLRKNIAAEYSKCKCGIIVYNKGLDSCPRVLPEMLACDLPVICADTFYFWKEMYITEKTGLIVKQDKIWNAVKYVLNNLDKYSPREHYLEHLSVKYATSYFSNLIQRFRTKEFQNV